MVIKSILCILLSICTLILHSNTIFAADYTLPADIGSGPFTNCSGTSPNYTCNTNFQFNGDTRITLTEDISLTISTNNWNAWVVWGSFETLNNNLKLIVPKGNIVFGGTTTYTGSIYTKNGDITFHRDVELTGDIEIKNGNVVFNSGTAIIVGNILITTNGNITFHANVELSGDMETKKGDFVFNNEAKIAGGILTQNGDITFQGETDYTGDIHSNKGNILVNNSNSKFTGDISTDNGTVRINDGTVVNGICTPTDSWNEDSCTGASPPHEPPDSFAECFNDDFNRTTLGTDWRLLKAVGFTPTMNGNQLQLTDNGGNRATGVVLEGDFPAEDNFVQLVFDVQIFDPRNTEGADGVAIVLSDSQIAPVTGAPGGSLGYANRNSESGFAGGWLGFGVDEYGNYALNSENKEGGFTNGRIRDAFAIRGQGSGTTGYAFINGVRGLSPAIDSNSSGHKYRVTIDTRNSETWVKAERDTSLTGNNYQELIPWTNATQTATSPDSFRLSLTGSTGGSVNNHLFDSFVISAADCGSIGNDVDHYRIVHDESALTCDTEKITFKACRDADCTQLSSGATSITLHPTSGWVDNGYFNGNILTFSNEIEVELEHTTAETVTLAITDQDVTYICVNASGTEIGCDLVFADSGFIFPLPATATPSEIDADKHIQQSCTNRIMTIAAVKKDTENPEQCIPALRSADGNVDIGFSHGYVSPNSGVLVTEVNGTEISTAGKTDISLKFNDDGESTFDFIYSDAGEITLNASLEVTLPSGATKEINGATNLIVHPAGLCVYSEEPNNECDDTNLSGCSAFISAGTEFPLKIKGVCEQESNTDFCATGNSHTPNYMQNGIAITHTLIAPDTASGGVSGTIGISTANKTDQLDDIGNFLGEYLLKQTVSEVGVFTFTADPPADYLGAGDVFAGATYTSANIGRFIPDHFQVTMSPDPPEFADECDDIFTYLGQPFHWEPAADSSYPGITITAMNGASAPATTTNYEGSFWKLGTTFRYTYADITAPVAVQPFTPATSQKSINNVTNINGTTTLSLTESDGFNYTRPSTATPITEFTPSVTLTLPQAELKDSDNVCYENSGACSDYTYTDITGATIRHGRSNANDVFGPGTNPLIMPVEVIWYNSTKWEPHTDDSCSIFTYAPAPAGIPVISSPTSPATISSGQGDLTLTPTTADAQGTTTIDFDFEDWLAPDPQATATFGISRGNDRIINWQEITR